MDKLEHYDIIENPKATLTKRVIQPGLLYKQLVDLGLDKVSYIHLQHFLQKNPLLTSTLKGRLSAMKTTTDLLQVIAQSDHFTSLSLSFVKI